MKVPLSRNLEVDLLFSGTTSTYFEAARSAGRPGLGGRSGPSADPDRPGRAASGEGAAHAAPYLVRWKDGHESVFTPSSGTLVQHRAAPLRARKNGRSR